MKKAEVVKTLRNGALKIEIRRYADGRFGFDWSQESYDRRKVRLHSLEDAEARARELLGISAAGRIDLLSIDPNEYAEFLRWKSARKRGAQVPALVESFIQSKIGKGRCSKYLAGLDASLTDFAKAFPGDINDLSRAAVENWLNARNVGARRWNDLLQQIVSLIRFARRENLVGAELTPVEQIERKATAVTVLTYTPNELERILAACLPAYLPTIALQAFCGLRPEEVAPDDATAKPGLDWSAVLWAKRKIDVPPAVSKVRRRRFAPLTDAAYAFLEDFKGATGPVAGPLRLWTYLRQLKRRSGVEWKPDALRHSFASYRLALTNDVGALALEMGTSVSVIFQYYLDLKHEDEARKWFAIRPKFQKFLNDTPANQVTEPIRGRAVAPSWRV
jgi:integrase